MCHQKNVNNTRSMAMQRVSTTISERKEGQTTCKLSYPSRTLSRGPGRPPAGACGPGTLRPGRSAGGRQLATATAASPGPSHWQDGGPGLGPPANATRLYAIIHLREDGSARVAAGAAPGMAAPSPAAAGQAPVTVIGRDPGPPSDAADDWQDLEYDKEADCPDSCRAEEPGAQ